MGRALVVEAGLPKGLVPPSATSGLTRIEPVRDVQEAIARVSADPATTDTVMVDARVGIPLAQTLYRVDPSIAVLLVTEDQELAPLERRLLVTYSLGLAVKAIAPHDQGEARDELLRAADLTQRRRSFRRTVDSANERLRAAAPPAEDTRKLAAALKESEERFKLLIDAIRDYALFMLDPDGKIATWNAGAARLFGLDEASALSRHVSELYTPEDVAAAVPVGLLEQATKTGTATREGHRRRADGGTWLSHTTLAARRDEDGTLLGFFEISRDVTERAALVEQLQGAIAMRDEFLLVAGHELRTPLTALKLQLSALRRELGEVASARRLDALERQSARLTGLIETLLDVSRINAGRLELSLQDVDLVAVVNEVVRRFGVELEQSGSSVSVDAPEAVRGHWDGLRLDTVVTNLVGNAIKYGRGKPIAIRVRHRAEHAVIEIEDQGIGIEKDALRRIFGRFERAVAAREYSGFGVGLWIVLSIVRAHGGTVAVESEPGRFTRFRVELPLSPRSG